MKREKKINIYELLTKHRDTRVYFLQLNKNCRVCAKN